VGHPINLITGVKALSSINLYGSLFVGAHLTGKLISQYQLDRQKYNSPVYPNIPLDVKITAFCDKHLLGLTYLYSDNFLAGVVLWLARANIRQLWTFTSSSLRNAMEMTACICILGQAGAGFLYIVRNVVTFIVDEIAKQVLSDTDRHDYLLPALGLIAPTNYSFGFGSPSVNTRHSVYTHTIYPKELLLLIFISYFAANLFTELLKPTPKVVTHTLEDFSKVNNLITSGSSS